jgi:type II secretory pathway component GspD/PulD (secretin)
VVFSLITAAGAKAQQPPTPSPPAPAAAVSKESPVLLKVQVVISRRQGDKTIGRQPYMLTVNADGPRANLKMGLQVAYPVGAVSDPKTANSVSYSYRDIGTTIDCSAKTLEGGRFKLDISLVDNSVAADDPNAPVKGLPQFRSFSLANETAILRDGQTAQVMTAAEKISGEVVTVDVTLNVVK